MSANYSQTTPSATQWSQPQQNPLNPNPIHNGHVLQSLTPPPGTPTLQQSQNMQNPMFAMMAMMQQMQQFVQHQPQLSSQVPALAPAPILAPAPAPTPAPAPLSAQQDHSVPQATDNRLIAQIIYEQTKRGKTYKFALESMHGHNGIMAYAWKDYYLENKETIDAFIENIRERNQLSMNTYPASASASPPAISISTTSEQKASTSRTKTLLLPLKKERETSASIKRKSKSSTPSTPTVRSARDTKEKAAKDTKKGDKESNDGKRRSRRTLNSLSSFPTSNLLALVPPAVAIDPETGLPAAPSRSPSPPIAEPSSKYTEQDAIFFYRRVAYDLDRNPDLTKPALVNLLHEKAPHHTLASWKTYWTKQEHVADKMVFLTQLDDEDKEVAIRAWRGDDSKSVAVSKRRKTAKVSYKETSDSEVIEIESTSVEEETSMSPKSTPNDGSNLEEVKHEEEKLKEEKGEEETNDEKKNDGDKNGNKEASHSGSEDDGGDDADSDELDDSDDDTMDSTDIEQDLGQAGKPFTKGEIRAMAKHIMSTPGWYEGNKDWHTFGDKYRRRALASWKEFYRRRSEEVDKVVEKFKKRQKAMSELKPQRGKPSWAFSNNDASPDKTKLKRKLSVADKLIALDEKRPRYEDFSRNSSKSAENYDSEP